MTYCKPRSDAVESRRADSGNSGNVFDRRKPTVQIAIHHNPLCQRWSDAFQLRPVHPDRIVHIHTEACVKLGSPLQQQGIRAACGDQNPFTHKPQQQDRHQNSHDAAIPWPESQNDVRLSFRGRAGIDSCARNLSARRGWLISAVRQRKSPE